VLARSQTRGPVDLTAAQLREQVRRARAGLRRLGVGPGDRVAAYAPNIPETFVLLLATASLGAIFSSCAPEFGTRSVVDRWQQIEPKVLVAVDGYRYGDKAIDRAGEVAAIRAALPSVEHVVTIGYLRAAAGGWPELLRDTDEPLAFEAVPFDHPLYVLYSSGTTGLPKPIVHGHGGILLEHLKMLALHHDLGPGDRFFWFTTTGWMMWNYLVSGPAVGAAVVLVDGNPAHPDLGWLWRVAQETGTTYFGTSAPFLLSCRKAGLVPRDFADLSRLRGVGSTGAPLPPEGFEWVYEAVSGDVMLASASGGTDVCTAFVGGVPLLPVRAGEIACRALGARVEAFAADGTPVEGELGELVITAPMPSMPVGFWGDEDGSRYAEAYFGTYPGVWRHGDWITIDASGACVITGRSDATLNRGGVRLGTSEFYSVVEGLDDVVDSVVVHLEDPEGGAGELLLFVVLRDGVALDDAMRARIARELRTALSPRHVPDQVFQVDAVPRTLSGKKLEVPVKRILTGTPIDRAAAKGALANPESLRYFADIRAARG
jgi:acetoacetyl-CoA synthetase